MRVHSRYLTQTRPARRALVANDTATTIYSDTPDDTMATTHLSPTQISLQDPTSTDDISMTHAGGLKRLKHRRPEPTQASDGLNDSHHATSSRRSSSTGIDELPPVRAGAQEPVRQKNAFDILRSANTAVPKPVTLGEEKIKHRFIEEEADESDEEEGLAWAGEKKKSNDDEDVEEDGVVEGLVDDKTRTAEEEEKDRLLADEKRRQIQAEDDAKELKYHQNATEGKFRGKRRDNAMGEMDFSDEDEERSRKKKRMKHNNSRNLGGEDTLLGLREP